MKVCVFGAASELIKREYIEKAERLGESLAKGGHSLVFGAGNSGMMGAAARGFKRGGGYIHGIVPRFFVDEGLEPMYKESDKTTYTDDMAQRKKLMEDEADVFVILPGGVGTMEEFFEVITLKQLSRHKKAVIVYNIDGFYDGLESFMRRLREEKFLSENVALYAFVDSAEEVTDIINRL